MLCHTSDITDSPAGNGNPCLIHSGKISRHKGQQTAEFAAALVVLILCVLMPFLNLAIIPVRHGLASGMITSYVQQLAVSEKASSAFAQVEQDDTLKKRLMALGGVNAKKITLTMLVNSTGSAGETRYDGPAKIPADWLPEGVRCPCSYSLELVVDAEISPLVTLAVGGPTIQGLNAPFSLRLSAKAPWENLGKDPVTRKFYLNE